MMIPAPAPPPRRRFTQPSGPLWRIIMSRWFEPGAVLTLAVAVPLTIEVAILGPANPSDLLTALAVTVAVIWWAVRRARKPSTRAVRALARVLTQIPLGVPLTHQPTGNQYKAIRRGAFMAVVRRRPEDLPAEPGDPDAAWGFGVSLILNEISSVYVLSGVPAPTRWQIWRTANLPARHPAGRVTSPDDIRTLTAEIAEAAGLRGPS